ncbi:CBS domain-containing protein [Balneolales bacterium ANBcel1]|nr:CBS domain-containing protein [Balneolales bacterium ANBcel1]
MLIRDTLSENVRPLRAADTILDALQAMADSGYSWLPIVDATTNRFIGMVSRVSASQHQSEFESVMAIREQRPVVTSPDQNIFETARVMEKHDLSMIAVLDEQRNYIGVVDRAHLFDRIVRSMNFTDFGSLVTVHFEERDFTLSQLVRIIEAEGGLILGLSVEAPTGNYPFYVVYIKLNLPDPARIVAALRRHEYIVDSQSTDNREDRRYEERADELMHYLNI